MPSSLYLILERDDHEPSPDRRAFQFEQRVCGSLRYRGITPADGFLQQAAGHPGIGKDSGIGTKRTCCRSHLMSVVGGGADLGRRRPEV